jgi:hypothetical protein
VAEEWLPFNGQIVNQDGWELYHAPLQENGVYGDPGGPVGQVYADSSGLQVKRRAGSAWVHGSWWRDTAEKLVPIAANGASQPRIDRIVLRRNNTTKNVTTVVIPGTAQVNPTAPPLTQAVGGTWDVPLAQVYVDPGAVSIANGKVTDERTYVGLRLWRPSALSLLPTTGVAPWQEAVLPDGSKYRWTGSAWTNVLTTTPYVRATNDGAVSGQTFTADADVDFPGTADASTGAWSRPNFVATRTGLYLATCTVIPAPSYENISTVLSVIRRRSGTLLESRFFPVGSRPTASIVMNMTAGEYLTWRLSPGASTYITAGNGGHHAEFAYLGSGGA